MPSKSETPSLEATGPIRLKECPINSETANPEKTMIKSSGSFFLSIPKVSIKTIKSQKKLTLYCYRPPGYYVPKGIKQVGQTAGPDRIVKPGRASFYTSPVLVMTLSLRLE